MRNWFIRLLGGVDVDTYLDVTNGSNQECAHWKRCYDNATAGYDRIDKELKTITNERDHLKRANGALHEELNRVRGVALDAPIISAEVNASDKAVSLGLLIKTPITEHSIPLRTLVKSKKNETLLTELADTINAALI